ncbi:hypothetical protein C0J52_04382 [Blattella germanica]|nr:hypothetical protein C0J52_04382 [Blattella germanica]
MLQTCQRKIGRKILSVTLQDRIRNENLRKMTNIEDAATLATFTKWKWAGHAMRINTTYGRTKRQPGTQESDAET